jgi:hypothetical protein
MNDTKQPLPTRDDLISATQQRIRECVWQEAELLLDR